MQIVLPSGPNNILCHQNSFKLQNNDVTHETLNNCAASEKSQL